MHYLVTAAPVLLAHGTYQYHEVDQEHALRWLNEHHKELTIAQVSSDRPYQQLLQADPQIVQLLAKEIDRFLPTVQSPLPAIHHDDEVLIVKPMPVQSTQQQGGFGGGFVPGQMPTIVDMLSFALFKRTTEQIIE